MLTARLEAFRAQVQQLLLPHFIRMQSWWRFITARRTARRLAGATLRLQSVARGFLARRGAQLARAAMGRLQSVARGFLARRGARRARAALERLQAVTRGFLTRRFTRLARAALRLANGREWWRRFRRNSWFSLSTVAGIAAIALPIAVAATGVGAVIELGVAGVIAGGLAVFSLGCAFLGWWSRSSARRYIIRRFRRASRVLPFQGAEVMPLLAVAA